MTYYELFQQAETADELKDMMKKEATTALILGNNPDRIKAIEDAGNKVALEKGW